MGQERGGGGGQRGMGDARATLVVLDSENHKRKVESMGSNPQSYPIRREGRKASALVMIFSWSPSTFAGRGEIESR